MKALLTSLLILVLTASSWAELEIEDLVVHRQGDNVNLRVNLRNTTRRGQLGPIVVRLYARQDAQDTWTEVKVWRNIGKVAPGYRVARDFFEAGHPFLSGLAGGGSFQVRATVEAPGVSGLERVVDFRG